MEYTFSATCADNFLIISRSKGEIDIFKRLFSALQDKPRCFPTWKALLPAKYEFKKGSSMAGKLCISETLYTGEAQRSNILILEISDTCITYLTLGKDSKKTVFLGNFP